MMPMETPHGRGALLTICIPSYNRGRRVRALVDYLLPTVEEFRGQIEIIVSNNVSVDQTRELLSEVKSEFFSFHNRDVHLPTAEEHMFAAAVLCSGEYIWFLGDDDIPNISVLRDLMDLLKLGRYDFLFFNSTLCDGYAGALESTVLRMNQPLIEASFDEIAPNMGLISSFAGLSNVVGRRSRLDSSAWPKIVEISFIYSHVVWWYVSFAHSNAVIVNQPLVTYRQDESGTLFLDFSKVAQRLGVGDFFFWGEGMIRLLKFMEDRGAITVEQIRRLWESRRDGSQYRLLDNIIRTVFEQVRVSSRAEPGRSRVSDEVLKFCTDWLLRADPSYYDLVSLLWLAQEAVDLVEEDRADRLQWIEADLGKLLQYKIDKSNKYIGLTRMYRGFDIYSHGSVQVAFRRGSHLDRREVLAYLDPVDSPGVLTAQDSASLNEKIDLALTQDLLALV